MHGNAMENSMGGDDDDDDGMDDGIPCADEKK